MEFLAATATRQRSQWLFGEKTVLKTVFKLFANPIKNPTYVVLRWVEHDCILAFAAGDQIAPTLQSTQIAYLKFTR